MAERADDVNTLLNSGLGDQVHDAPALAHLAPTDQIDLHAISRNLAGVDQFAQGPKDRQRIARQVERARIRDPKEVAAPMILERPRGQLPIEIFPLRAVETVG